MWDILIVGSGAAGMMAAVSAAREGAKCLVLEKGMHIAVSNGARAGGPALAGLRIQRDLDAEVPEETLFQHMYRFSRGTVNAGLLRRAIHQGSIVEDIFQNCGVTWNLLPDSYGVGFQARVGFTEGGEKRWKPLQGELERLGGQVRFSQDVQRIVRGDSGFELITASGEKWRGRSVILATGGYLGGQEMLREHFGQVHVIPLGNKLSNGTGIRMAIQLGGMLDRNWGICANEFCGANHRIHGAQFSEETRYAICAGLLVNRQGNRFMNEQLLSDHPLSSGGEALLREGAIYAVLDDSMRQGLHQKKIYDFYGSPEEWHAGKMNPDPLRGKGEGIEKAVSEGWAWQGSAQELSFRLNMPELEETLRHYNDACRWGIDQEFGKAPYLLRALDEENLTIYEYEPSAWCTIGGVKTDEYCRMLSEDQQPVPGVYVAGVDNGSCYCSPYYDNEGAALGLALTTGVIAGMHAAKYIRTH